MKSGIQTPIAVAAVCAALLCAAVIAVQDPAATPLDASDWDVVSAHGFARVSSELTGAWLDAGPSEAELDVLVQALDGEAERAARAAVLLGALENDRARRALSARLERRVAAPSRGEIGVDIVAARALREELTEEESMALVRLLGGDRPHPDLAVRVECARSVLLGAGDRSVVPFLLSVLRAETPAQDQSPITWPRITTLAWVKTRAAQALSEAAGTELGFRPDGSWAHQVAEAERLAAFFE